MTAQPLEPNVPMSIQPGPLPTTVAVIHDPDQRLVVLVFVTPAGESYFFLPAEGALHVAEEIRAAANAARIGLQLPPGGLRGN